MISVSRLGIIAAGAAFLAVSTPAIAQDPVQWTGTPSAKSVAAGGTLTVKMSGKLEEGWYIYSVTQGPGGPIPTRVTLPDSNAVGLGGKITPASQPKVQFDENFGIDVETHGGDAVVLNVPVKVLPKAKAGKQEFTVAIRYQACNGNVCLPPRTKRVKVPVTVTAPVKKK